MSEKEYIVSLKRGVDASNFKAEMTQSSGDANIPARSVDVVNERLLSTRNTHYSLTDEEAEQLKNDSRVAGVNIPPQDDDKTEIGLHAVQIGDYKKTTADSGNHLNWGMRRCIESTNVYGTSSNDPSGDYTYHLDGTGVDVVIQDTGIQADHPEFFDASGTSRVQQIDWYTASGLSGTQSANHYSDTSGHGTHVAGTAAGLRYGWAKNARIYSVNVAGLTSNSGAISVTDCFDVIKGWHNNKPIDPATGYKRPTIVNMSWGYGGYSHNVTNVVYRGTSVSSGWSGISRDTAHGIVGSYRSATYGYRVVDRRTSVDTDVQEMIDAGIHVCCAAGNSYQKVDVPSGADYNNYFVSTTWGTIYYHRGGSPFDDEAMIVGNVDSNTHSGGLEQKAGSSENGPGVDIYAPGTNIISSNSTASSYYSGTYPGNSNFKICTISGTSMASPQVCGVGALILQANPHMTPAELKNYFITNSVSNMLYSTGSDTDYGVERSLKGGNNRFLYNPFSSQYKFRIVN